MKKISAILLALVLCISVLSVVSFAAEGDMVVHIQAHESWEKCYAYNWPESLGGWPGTELSAGDDGLYTLTISGNFDGMVIGAGDGQPQTVDITDLDLSAGEAWIVIGEAGADGKHTYTISYTAPGEGGNTETPDVPVATPGEPVETPDEPTETPDAPAATPSEGNVLVHAYVPEGTSPCFWAWESASQKNAFTEWPGEAMTKDGDWWIIEVPNWCDGMIVNDGGSGEQTQDITVEAGKEVWIVVNPYDWKASTAYYELPNVDEVIPDEPPVVEVPEVSRPTVGEPAATTAAASKNDKADDVESEDNTVEALGMTFTKKAQALIVLGTALLAIVAIAFALSIPKKIR